MATDVRRFVDEIRGNPADFIWPIIERHAIWSERQSPRLINYVPGTNNTLARGHLMYIPGTIRPDMNVVERMNRHKMLADLIALGPINMLKVMSFCLTAKDIEHRMGELLGCRAALIPCRYPGFAFDIDYPGDMIFAEKRLRERSEERTCTY